MDRHPFLFILGQLTGTAIGLLILYFILRLSA